MGSKEYPNPFTGEPEGPINPSGTVGPGSHPALPATERELVERLLSEDSICHEVGDGSRHLEVRTQLSGNNRGWKYRVAVFSDGEEVEDLRGGAYPTEKRFPRDLGTDDEDDRDSSAHRLKIAQYAARCHLDIWTQAHRLLLKKAPRRRYWLWIPIILVLASVGAIVAYYYWNQGSVVKLPEEQLSKSPVLDCAQTPEHPDCPQSDPSKPPDIDEFFE